MMAKAHEYGTRMNERGWMHQKGKEDLMLGEILLYLRWSLNVNSTVDSSTPRPTLSKSMLLLKGVS